ncbi:hypothetical protein MTO96_006107 [Rhipicephalus appendiculatus]
MPLLVVTEGRERVIDLQREDPFLKPIIDHLQNPEDMVPRKANGSILDGGRRMAGVTAGCFPAPQQAKERRFTAAVQLRLYVVAPYVCALSTVALVAVGFGWASALKLWWSWRL